MCASWRNLRLWALAVSAVAITLATVNPAAAVSVRLRYGVDVAAQATTAATEPSLAGTVLHDELVPFRIRNDAGATVCRGVLQNRVVRSSATGLLLFYYSFRQTRGPGRLLGFHTTGFARETLRVGYRTDGLGTKAPTRIYRWPSPGDAVTAGGMDLDCAAHEESRFVLIRTEATSFSDGGVTDIITADWYRTSVNTVQPD